ncbi:putative Seipin like protein [Glarea lozoyensis 74030]|nr:putative Seipin like protein [Glarea lozoyensis 74030]
MVVKDLVLTPFRVATSKPAQKTYINLILFLSTSLTLLGLSTLAYVLFYYLYVPQIGIERPIHLQYGDGPHPHALIPLTSLVPSQPYTIHLTLTLPRSPPNLTLGPFMLALTLLSSSYKPIVVPTPTIHVHPLPTLSLYLTSIQEPDIIHTVRRPALIPYTSRLVSLSTRILGLPLYILGLRTETSTLEVELAENLVFNRKDGVPAYAMLEVQAGQTLQVYDATMYVRARFGGLRWWMWNHRILSAF